jgi:hypothetical protein
MIGIIVLSFIIGASIGFFLACCLKVGKDD